ncbi:MAG TPA: tryptophan synthase subunit alpha [Candidatus Cybelea sp.]|jgi:tryptophan synthase alpha chain
MLTAVFERTRSERRLAFIPYLMAGDPDLATTEQLLSALTAAGADLIELGVPYSDPLADGPTIAAAGQRALHNGVGLTEVLTLAQRCRDTCAPIVLFTYYNPVYQFGIAQFAREAAQAGVAGAIVPDLALEESAELRAALAEQELAMPLLVAPSTPPERARRIANAAGGFVYVVSRLGVTGARTAPDFEPLRKQLASLRELTDKPLAVGFGLSRPEDVREIASSADAVVVGSALIDAYAGTSGMQAVECAQRFLEPLVRACAAKYAEPSPSRKAQSFRRQG